MRRIAKQRLSYNILNIRPWALLEGEGEMKDEYIDTAFGNLINSYAFLSDGLSDEDIEKALRSHAKKWSGCISCRYSKSPASPDEKNGNIWLNRKCQVGLTQDGCEMYEKFPEAEDKPEAEKGV